MKGKELPGAEEPAPAEAPAVGAETAPVEDAEEPADFEEQQD